MAEEREKSREAAGVIKEKTKEEMGQYIKEKEKVCDSHRKGGGGGDRAEPYNYVKRSREREREIRG